MNSYTPITLQEYITSLQALIEKDPTLSDTPVWIASDEEGNNYLPISFKPSVGYIEGNESYSESFIKKDELEETLEESGDLFEDDFDNEALLLEARKQNFEDNYHLVVLVN